MERLTKKTSKNSSIPPSRTTDDQNSTTPGSKKKGPVQNDESLDNNHTVETETVAKMIRCSACSKSLSQVSVTAYDRRARFDIVFKKRVEHIDTEIKYCPCFHHVT